MEPAMPFLESCVAELMAPQRAVLDLHKLANRVAQWALESLSTRLPSAQLHGAAHAPWVLKVLLS
jgi:hypothetical protein